MDCTIFTFPLQNNNGQFFSFSFKIKKTYFEIITYNFDLRYMSKLISLQFSWCSELRVKCFDVIAIVTAFYV